MKSILPKIIRKKKIQPRPETIAERRHRENSEMLLALHNSPFEIGLRAARAGGK
jgi:hypothetical protein